MSVHSLSIRDFRYIKAIAELGSFTKAADACGVTQPAISDRIRHIEATLGTLLFERNRRSVIVTERGTKIARLAEQLLNTAADVETVCKGQHEPLTGPLHLGVISTLGPYLLPRLLAPIKSEFPKLELTITEGLTSELLDQLSSGNIDLLLAAEPIDQNNIRIERLFFEPFWLAAPIDHRISAIKQLSSKNLAAEHMILLQDGHCLSDQALTVCPSKRRNGANRLETMSLETLRHIVAFGDRYTLLPELAVGDSPPMQDAISYSLVGNNTGRHIALCWRNSYRERATAAAFGDLVRNSVSPRCRVL